VRLFLDANILFSAVHSPNGGARQLFKLAAAGKCELVSSLHAASEAERNLKLKSFSRLKEMDQVLQSVELLPDAGPGLVSWAMGLGLPDNDAPILAVAAAAGSDLLVTGDRRHFGHLFGETVKRVRVVSLVEALEIVVGSR
jgi:predicted nucleic acid-binding protein